MNSKPFLSILVPSFNQGDFIESTVKSVLFQDFQDWELIIQDGGSKDTTEEVCRAYEKADSRIHFFSEKDKGFADAVNKAIDRAKGTIAAIQSSDDFYSYASVFSEAVQLFKQYPNLYLVSAYHSYVDKNLKEICCPPPEQEGDNGFINPHKLFNLQVHFPQSSTFFNLERARYIDKLNTQVDMVADTDFWIRMANYSPSSDACIYRVDKSWSCVIVHESQRSVDQCQFSLGRARMFYHYLGDSRFAIPKEKKEITFHGNWVDALEYFQAQQRDTSELLTLYSEAYSKKIPLHWKIKDLLKHSSFFRNLLYKHIPEKSSLDLLSYPRGESKRWFELLKNNTPSFTG